MPFVCLCVCACMCTLSHFKIKLYILFSYEYIFTKFAENVYGCENMSVKNDFTSLKKNMAAIANCWKIIGVFQNLKYCS